MILYCGMTFDYVLVILLSCEPCSWYVHGKFCTWKRRRSATRLYSTTLRPTATFAPGSCSCRLQATVLFGYHRRSSVMHAVSRVHQELLCQGGRTTESLRVPDGADGDTRFHQIICCHPDQRHQTNSGIVKLKMFFGATYGPVLIVSANPL